jgi:hypothetical protein
MCLVYIIAGITCGGREGESVREELVPKELVSQEQAWRRPRLRAVEVLATAVEGRQMYCLRDPGEPDGAAVLVSREALLLLGLMDGERDQEALRAAFALRTGMQLMASQVEELVRGLDEACLLVGPRFEQHRAAQRADFHAAPLRAAIPVSYTH